MNRNKKKTGPYHDVLGVPETGKIDLDQFFSGAFGSVELEIGFGKGHFILNRAEKNPQTLLLGLEIKRKWVHLVNERAIKRKISNVEVRYADARQVLPRIAEDGCFDRVFINFPDPWWKARHEKRIVTTAPLIAQVSRLLRDNGELFVQTDVDFRAEAYLKLLSADQTLEPADGNGVLSASPFDVRSLRETKCEEVGLPIYRLLFRRRR